MGRTGAGADSVDRAWHELDQRERDEMASLLFTTAQRRRLEFARWLYRHGELGEYPLELYSYGDASMQVLFLLDVVEQIINPLPVRVLWRGRGQ